MTGWRHVGMTGTGQQRPIDKGTLALQPSPAPADVGTQETSIDWEKVCVQFGVTSVSALLGPIPYGLNALLLSMTNEQAYQFFCHFFDHYLVRRFLHHHIYGGGTRYTLSKQEMIDCNPAINLWRSEEFRNLVERERARLRLESRASHAGVPFTAKVPSSARTNGTLGQFRTLVTGHLYFQNRTRSLLPGVLPEEPVWQVSGRMKFEDTWNFDVKVQALVKDILSDDDRSNTGRSWAGQVKTMVGKAYLPGSGFPVTSAEVEFLQTEDEPTVTWEGGVRPGMALDKVAVADVSAANSLREDAR